MSELTLCVDRQGPSLQVPVKTVIFAEEDLFHAFIN